jgi:hypothetical protein
VPDAVELTGKQAWDALVEHFGVEVIDTEPMPLDELPALPTLEETELERWARVLAPLDDAARRAA